MTIKEFQKSVRKAANQLERKVITQESYNAKIAELVTSATTAGLNVNADGTVNEAPVAVETPIVPPAEPVLETPAVETGVSTGTITTAVAPTATTPATPSTPATTVAKTPAAKKTPEFKVKVDQLLSYMAYWLKNNAPSLAPPAGVTMLAHYRANRAQIDAVLPVTQQNPQLIAWEMTCTNKTVNNEGDENGPKDGFRLKTGRFNPLLPTNTVGELGTVLCYPQWWRDDKAARGSYNVQWNLVRNFVDALEKREATAAAAPASVIATPAVATTTSTPETVEETATTPETTV
jgi:hypothetical protein